MNAATVSEMTRTPASTVALTAMLAPPSISSADVKEIVEKMMRYPVTTGSDGYRYILRTVDHDFFSFVKRRDWLTLSVTIEANGSITPGQLTMGYSREIQDPLGNRHCRKWSIGVDAQGAATLGEKARSFYDSTGFLISETSDLYSESRKNISNAGVRFNLHRMAHDWLMHLRANPVVGRCQIDSFAKVDPRHWTTLKRQTEVVSV